MLFSDFSLCNHLFSCTKRWNLKLPDSQLSTIESTVATNSTGCSVSRKVKYSSRDATLCRRPLTRLPCCFSTKKLMCTLCKIYSTQLKSRCPFFCKCYRLAVDSSENSFVIYRESLYFSFWSKQTYSRLPVVPLAMLNWP